MKPKLIYRVAAMLLLLFAVGHTFSFHQVDPAWGLNAMLAEMRSIRFSIAGTERTYWDLFLGSGLTVGVFFLFSAVLAWQLSMLRAETLRELRLATWGFAAAYAGVAIVSRIHLFAIPLTFSTVIALCLALGAWTSGRPGQPAGVGKR
jgi:hypothetical protein